MAANPGGAPCNVLSMLNRLGITNVEQFMAQVRQLRVLQLVHALQYQPPADEVRQEIDAVGAPVLFAVNVPKKS